MIRTVDHREPGNAPVRPCRITLASHFVPVPVGQRSRYPVLNVFYRSLIMIA
jgi:hypothetical protein